MHYVQIILQVLVICLGLLTAVSSILLFVRLQWPAPFLWVAKLYTSALSFLFMVIAMLTIAVGLLTGSVFISILGLYNLLAYGIHSFLVTRPPDGWCDFDAAFGLHWKEKIHPEINKHFLSSRTILKLPAVPMPRLEQNVPFATIPGTNRKLLCDVWRPHGNVVQSGLAFIYLHGSAWYFLDKDFGTRPFFRHLASQGHVIMDVAYRLAPETGMMGMVNDVKRAINWMRENSDNYGIHPDKIVVGGGSAGAHLALMAAYTANNPAFTPQGLENKDLNVCAVVSMYGPTDLTAMYYHDNQHVTTRFTSTVSHIGAPRKMPRWLFKVIGKDCHRLGLDKQDIENAGTFAYILGGHPDQCPETYALFSPVNHVHLNCPPTLLIHGKDDVLVPEKNVRLMYVKLAEKKIPTVFHTLPQTDHGFDLQLPKISPSAHNAIFDVERFLALMVFEQNISGQTKYLQTEGWII